MTTIRLTMVKAAAVALLFSSPILVCGQERQLATYEFRGEMSFSPVVDAATDGGSGLAVSVLAEWNLLTSNFFQTFFERQDLDLEAFAVVEDLQADFIALDSTIEADATNGQTFATIDFMAEVSYETTTGTILNRDPAERLLDVFDTSFTSFVFTYRDSDVDVFRNVNTIRLRTFLPSSLSIIPVPDTASPTRAPITTLSPTRVPTTNDPTQEPTVPPVTSTMFPTLTPATVSPSETPTPSPTAFPTAAPTVRPTTVAPTEAPTGTPSTISPTNAPTHAPTTLSPSETPTSALPSNVPTMLPTSSMPTNVPTTQEPTTLAPGPISLPPSTAASAFPSLGPTINPTAPPITNDETVRGGQSTDGMITFPTSTDDNDSGDDDGSEESGPSSSLQAEEEPKKLVATGVVGGGIVVAALTAMFGVVGSIGYCYYKCKHSGDGNHHANGGFSAAASPTGLKDVEAPGITYEEAYTNDFEIILERQEEVSTLAGPSYLGPQDTDDTTEEKTYADKTATDISQTTQYQDLLKDLMTEVPIEQLHPEEQRTRGLLAI